MANEDDQTYKSDFFRVPILWLKWAGIPIKPLEISAFRKLLYLIYSAMVLLIFPGTYVLAEIIEGTRLLHDMDRFTFNLGYSLTHFLGLIKIIIFAVKREQIWNICQKFETGRMAPNAERGGNIEFKYVKDAIKLVNFQGYFFNAVAIVLLCFRGAYTVVEKSEYTRTMQNLDPNATTVPILPTAYYSYFPFSIEKSPVYEIAIGYQIISAWLYAIYISAIDAIITGYMIHIKAQFLILKNSIDLYVQKAEEQCVTKSGLDQEEIEKLIQTYSNNKNPVAQESLPPAIQKYATHIVKECARHHFEIIEVCEKVENEFSILILLQFLASLVMICFNLFQLYLVHKLSDVKSYRFGNMVFYQILLLFQLLTYCGNGNEVILHSSSVSDAVFQSNWIVTDQSSKKEFLLIMMRAQRPIKFTAAKFAFLSLVTYMSILKGSASYFMFLQKTVNVQDMNMKRLRNE